MRSDPRPYLDPAAQTGTTPLVKLMAGESDSRFHELPSAGDSRIGFHRSPSHHRRTLQVGVARDPQRDGSSGTVRPRSRSPGRRPICWINSRTSRNRCKPNSVLGNNRSCKVSAARTT